MEARREWCTCRGCDRVDVGDATFVMKRIALRRLGRVVCDVWEAARWPGESGMQGVVDTRFFFLSTYDNGIETEISCPHFVHDDTMMHVDFHLPPAIKRSTVCTDVHPFVAFLAPRLLVLCSTVIGSDHVTQFSSHAVRGRTSRGAVLNPLFGRS